MAGLDNMTDKKGDGVKALLQLRHNHFGTKLPDEAETLLEEMSASMVLVGGRRLTLEEIANMSVGELLALSLPNHINFRVWPSEKSFRK